MAHQWRFKKECVRLSTYAKLGMLTNNWPSSLARSGLFYHEAVDKIVCFSCNLGLDYRQENFDADCLHRRHAPRCAIVNELDAGSVPMTVLSSDIYGEIYESDDVGENSSRYGDAGVVYHSAYTRANGRGVFDGNTGTNGMWTNTESFAIPLRIQSNVDSNHPREVQGSVLHRIPDNSENQYDLRASENENFEENRTENIQRENDVSSRESNDNHTSRILGTNDDQTRLESGPLPAASNLLPRQDRRDQKLLAASSRRQGSNGRQQSRTSVNRPTPPSRAVHSSAVRSRTSPRHPSYVNVGARIRSFQENPVGEDYLKHRALTAAGFFCTDDALNSVRCFFCDCGLSGGDWCGEDDPWAEHTRAFSACLYLKMVKREDMELSEEDWTNLESVDSVQSEDDLALESYSVEDSEDNRNNVEPNIASGREFLRSENESLREQERCMSPGCFNRRDSVYLMCGHVIHCRPCSKNVWNRHSPCPMCNDSVVGLCHVFT